MDPVIDDIHDSKDFVHHLLVHVCEPSANGTGDSHWERYINASIVSKDVPLVIKSIQVDAILQLEISTLAASVCSMDGSFEEKLFLFELNQ